jgi:hypothetical protein
MHGAHADAEPERECLEGGYEQRVVRVPVAVRRAGEVRAVEAVQLDERPRLRSPLRPRVPRGERLVHGGDREEDQRDRNDGRGEALAPGQQRLVCERAPRKDAEQAGSRQQSAHRERLRDREREADDVEELREDTENGRAGEKRCGEHGEQLAWLPPRTERAGHAGAGGEETTVHQQERQHVPGHRTTLPT